MKYFFTLFFLFVTFFSFSQEGFESGYIITNKGDTLRGKIKDRKYTAGAANCDKIYFIGVDGKEEGKTPEEIKQYCKKGIYFFRTLPIGLESKLKFAEILEFGDVILFGYTSNSLISTTSDVLSKSVDKNKDGKPDAPKNLEYFLQKRKDPNSLMKVRPKKFQETTTFYFQNDSELVKKIENKILGYDDIRLVVKTHNDNELKK
jgi:hypothetical protein